MNFQVNSLPQLSRDRIRSMSHIERLQSRLISLSYQLKKSNLSDIDKTCLHLNRSKIYNKLALVTKKLNTLQRRDYQETITTYQAYSKADLVKSVALNPLLKTSI